MKNFVFISPNFPVNYWQFCRQLRNNGLRVLGIGDQPYDTLLPELKSALHEYYKVGSMENFYLAHVNLIPSALRHLPVSGSISNMQPSSFAGPFAAS